LHVPGTRPGISTHYYLGLSLVLLAGIGMATAVRSRSNRARRADVVSLALVGIAALVWSGPPTMSVGSLEVRLPAWYVMGVTTTWRIYGRFGIVVSFATCVLAGIGIAALTRRGPVVARWVAVAAIALVVSLDVWSPTSTYPTKTLEEPAIYAVLRAQPLGSVAEYPIFPLDVGAYDQLYRQEFHHRRLLNGYASGSAAEARALTLSRLDDETAGRLAVLGIRYVVLDTLRAPYEARPPPGTPTGRYRLIAQDGKWRLYEVVGAGPSPAAL
jgi:hypothetical protein